MVQPRPPAGDARIAGGRPRRVDERRRRVVAVVEPAVHPLPDVPGHVEQAELVRGKRPHGRGVHPGVGPARGARATLLGAVVRAVPRDLVAPPVDQSGPARPRRVLPLGLGRKPGPGPRAEGGRIVPAHEDHRVVTGLREARRGGGAMTRVAHEPEIVLDRHLGRRHLERDGKADGMTGPFHVEAVGIGLDASHLEAAGRNPDPCEVRRGLPGADERAGPGPRGEDHDEGQQPVVEPPRRRRQRAAPARQGVRRTHTGHVQRSQRAHRRSQCGKAFRRGRQDHGGRPRVPSRRRLPRGDGPRDGPPAGRSRPGARRPGACQLRTAMPITSNRAPRSRAPEPRNARAGGSPVK